LCNTSLIPLQADNFTEELMKNLLKISALAAVLVASATFASADTIQLGSYATGQSAQGNSNTALNYAGFVAGSNTGSAPAYGSIVSGGTGTSYFLNPGTVWLPPVANSTYVGAAPTAGPVGTTNPAFGYYTFTTTFNATGIYGGSFSILADDTTAVFLNGSSTALIGFGALGSNIKCADSAPTCTVLTTFNVSGLSLTGSNTLTFIVRQAGDGAVGLDPSGLDFRATLTSVPEPNTLLMLGTGLMGSAGMLFRRMRS
jgi:hypothetical protein